jgi:hypothetical protein
MTGSKKVQQNHIRVNFSFIEYINTLNSCISLDMRGAGRLVVVLLSVMLFSSGVSAAFAQSSQIPPLSVSTELPLYESGDRVVFSGAIKSPDVNNLIDVTVRIVGPIINGTGATNIVTVKQVRPLLDGTFSDNFVVGGPLWSKAGDYKIIVNYGPQKAETMFFYNGGTDVPVPVEPKTCPEGQILDGAGNCINPPGQTKPNCGAGTVYDEATNSCVVAPPPEEIECPPGEELVDGKCVETGEPEEPTPINCGPGTHAEGGICVPDTKPVEDKKGCLIATAAFGTELAPQVQLLREVRDGVLYSTGAGTTFMAGFNEFYYAFSPAVADLERQSPLFKEVVKTAITPMLSTMSILNYANIDSEQEVLGYGIGVILLNIGMYFVAPALVILKVKGLVQKRRL